MNFMQRARLCAQLLETPILQGVLVGDKGVGKTFAMDVVARVIAGLGETSKFNQHTDVRTLLHYSANSTLPLTTEDNESSNILS